MNKMRSFLIFGLFVFSQVQSGHSKPSDEDIRMIATVKEYPSNIEKCTAIFVRSDALLTTARCLYCQENCNLFVYALSDHLTAKSDGGKGIIVNVSKVVIHPDFERWPNYNDIALIKLDNYVSNAVIANLPNSTYDNEFNNAKAFKWLFSKNRKDFYLHVQHGRTISRDLCTTVLDTYVDAREICDSQMYPIPTGPFERGVPLITRSDERVVLGIYNDQKPSGKPLIQVYQSVYPFVDWIHAILKCNFNCTGENDDLATASPHPKTTTTMHPLTTTMKPLIME